MFGIYYVVIVVTTIRCKNCIMGARISKRTHKVLEDFTVLVKTKNNIRVIVKTVNKYKGL